MTTPQRPYTDTERMLALAELLRDIALAPAPKYPQRCPSVGPEFAPSYRCGLDAGHDGACSPDIPDGVKWSEPRNVVADSFLSIACGARRWPADSPHVSQPAGEIATGKSFGVSATLYMPTKVSHAVYYSTSDPTPITPDEPSDPMRPRYHRDVIEALRAVLDDVLDRTAEREHTRQRKAGGVDAISIDESAIDYDEEDDERQSEIGSEFSAL